MNEKEKSISKLQSWIIASRPKTLFAAVVPVFVGSALANYYNVLQIRYSLIALACSLLIQIGTNFHNDLYDFLKGADNEKRKGPQRVLASGLITVNEMKIDTFFIFLLAFLLGLYLVYVAGITILVIGIISILAALAYTSGPYPLAYNGLGDVFVFMFFGIIGTMGTFYIHANEFTWLAFFASLPVGALVTNILVVNNYRDIEEDKAAGKNTLAVKLGKTFTRYQYIFLLAISFLTPAFLFFFFKFDAWIFLPYITLPMAYNLIKMLKTLEGMELNKALELTARLSAIFGILFSAGILL